MKIPDSLLELGSQANSTVGVEKERADLAFKSVAGSRPDDAAAANSVKVSSRGQLRTFVDLLVRVDDLEHAVAQRNVDLQNALRRSLLFPLLKQILLHVLQPTLLKADPDDALQYVAVQLESGDLSQFDLIRLT